VAVVEWVGEHRGALASAGISVAAPAWSPVDYVPSSVSFAFESTAGLGQLTVWETCDAEVLWLRWEDRRPTVRAVTIADRTGLDRAVGLLTGAISARRR
jgi:hypothetical protein